MVRKRYVRRPPGKRFDDKYTLSTVKHLPSQMVWGLCPKMVLLLSVFCLQKPLSMGQNMCKCSQRSKNFTCKFTIVRYLCRMALLATVPKFLRTFWLTTTSSFSSGKKAVRTLIRSRISGPTVSEKRPSSGEELVKVIKEVWVKEISKECCQSLIGSILRRMEAVIKTRGGHSAY